MKLRMDYLNSASAKMISLILTKLEELYSSGLKIDVLWYYNTDDDDIQSEGEIYQMLKKVPIKNTTNIACIIFADISPKAVQIDLFNP